MRWRVGDIDPETRKIARAAAKAAGLPLGAWLDRAIRSQVGASQAEPLEQEIAPARTVDGAPSLAEISMTPALAADETGGDTPEQRPPSDARSDVTADPEEKPVKPRNAPGSPYRGRAVGLLAVAVLAVAVIVGVIWLWSPFESTDGQDASAVRPVEAPSAEAPGQPPVADRETTKATGSTAPTADAPQTLEQIIEALRRDAVNGDPMAQHDLALAYVNGRGVPQNYQLAAEWFEKAAKAGSERAQFNLAVLYENALGVPQDLERAFALYLAAAEQGFGPAQHNVGVAYAQGRGTARDYHAAALWFRRAADQGIAPAQFNLGMIYERGLAGPPDEQTAYGWYRRAAAGGNEEAVARLAAIEGRIASAPEKTKPGARPTKADVAEIQRLLDRLSFNAGPADGKAGKATREAIRQYQRVAGLSVTGEPSGALLDHLRQVVGMMNAGSK